MLTLYLCKRNGLLIGFDGSLLMDCGLGRGSGPIDGLCRGLSRGRAWKLCTLSGAHLGLCPFYSFYGVSDALDSIPARSESV
jgi:hypothetical protein